MKRNLKIGVILSLILFFVGGCSAIEKKQRQLQVKDVVAKNNDKWSYCYKKALEKNKGFEGDMEFQWEVSYLQGQEKIRNIKVENSTVRSSELAHCMKKAIATLRFDFPEKRKVPIRKVSYPFSFRNDKQTTLQR